MSNPIVVGKDAVTSRDYVIAGGEGVLEAGRLLKLDGGKLKACNTGDTPHSILLEDVDATGADVECFYLNRGVVAEDEVDYGSGSGDEFREALRAVGIILQMPR
jgi:hypothetical protein